MSRQDLRASRWASPDVRLPRGNGWGAATRTPSPQKSLSQGALAGSTGASTASTPLASTSVTTTSTTSHAHRHYQARALDLQRFHRLFRRLSWKANSLTHWSHRALSLAQEHTQGQRDYRSSEAHAHPNPAPSGPTTSLGRYEMEIDPIEAERQFKIDFYEFYSLLERGLVYLLGVWGIMIDASGPLHEMDEDTQQTTRSGSGQHPRASGTSIIGNSRAFHGSSHRFHANVLSALDHPSNPLHQTLGRGDVREYIGVAKEFRNKWKDVEARPDDAFEGDERFEEAWDHKKVRRYEKVLQDLKLDELLGAILGGLKVAGDDADAEIRRLTRAMGETSDGKDAFIANKELDADMADAPFEVGYYQIDYDYEMQL